MTTAAAEKWELRPDLDLIRFEGRDDGKPSWLVHDPAAGTYDLVEWPECELLLLLRKPSGVAELSQGVRERTTLRPAPRDIEAYVADLGERGWLRGSSFWKDGAKAASGRRSAAGWLGRVLFVQIPLFNPERFLAATAGVARVALHPFSLVLLAALSALGLYLALPYWEEYWGESLGALDWRSLRYFIVALVVVKTVHEFAHAYAATLAGARVPAMGVALFFFMPLVYCDVTDVWRLPWKKRLTTASAGMLAEIFLGGLAILGWVFAPPDTPLSLALARLSSVALLSTLLTNLNPGPRFDGYYILSCLFRVENLRARSMRLLHRAVLRLLGGVVGENPERHVGGSRVAGMTAYAVYAFFYRLGLGVGLTAMCYFALPKALGLAAAAVGVWAFLLRPIQGEIILFWRERKHMRPTLAGMAVLAGMAFLVYWAVVPRPRSAYFPGTAKTLVEEAVRTRRAGEVAEVLAERDREVTAGTVLLRLRTPLDASRRKQAEWALREAEAAEEQAWRGASSRLELSWRRAEAERLRGDLAALDVQAGELEAQAPADGRLVVWDQTLRAGLPLPRGRLLGWVVAGPVRRVEGFSPVELAGDIVVGARVSFFPDDGSEPIPGTITALESSPATYLSEGHLAAELEARRSGDGWLPDKPAVRVMVALERDAPRAGQTGRVWFATKPKSLVREAGNRLRTLIVKESAF